MPMSSSNSWLLSLKVVLISTGLVSMAVALKLSAPVVSDLVASQVPSLWSSALSWLRPPYLYILINCIIISIVASSKLHPKPEDSPPAPELVMVPSPVSPGKISGDAVRSDYAAYNGAVLSEYGYDANVLPKVISDSYEVAGAVAEGTVVSEAKKEIVEEKSKERASISGGEDAVVSIPVRTSLQRKDSMEFWLNENQKPPVSSRFGHRKSVKASPEGGKSLGVAKPKRHDTLESTWKTITDGRSMPLTRHLKKSDTWDTHVRRMDENTPPKQKMNKSETFHERSSGGGAGSSPLLSPSTGSGRLRKEPSLSQDELNRRVEAFIKKFNEEMRLQRQESLNQYQEMIKSGAQASLAH